MKISCTRSLGSSTELLRTDRKLSQEDPAAVSFSQEQWECEPLKRNPSSSNKEMLTAADDDDDDDDVFHTLTLLILIL